MLNFFKPTVSLLQRSPAPAGADGDAARIRVQLRSEVMTNAATGVRLLVVQHQHAVTDYANGHHRVRPLEHFKSRAAAVKHRLRPLVNVKNLPAKHFLGFVGD